MVKKGKRAINIGGGAYFAYAIGGSGEGNGTLFGTPFSKNVRRITFGEDRSTALSAMDYGVNATINVGITNGLDLNLNYGYGMSNISPGNTRNNGFVTDVNNRNWGVSAIYSFK